jgi:hypothetical protein
MLLLMDASAQSGPLVVAVFTSQEAAAQALEVLRAAGVQPEQVSLMMSDQPRAAMPVPPADADVAGGAASGATVGGLVGGLAGWLLGIGALVVPGVGPIIGAGALGSLLAGAAIGAAAGGLLGGLVALGIPPDAVEDYASHVREGRVLLTVGAADAATAEHLRATLESVQPYELRVYGTGGPAVAPPPVPPIETSQAGSVEPIPDPAPAAITIENTVERITEERGTPDEQAI